MGDLLPLTYVTRILQAPWLGEAVSWGDVGVSLGIAVMAAGVALLAFAWE